MTVAVQLNFTCTLLLRLDLRSFDQFVVTMKLPKTFPGAANILIIGSPARFQAFVVGASFAVVLRTYTPISAHAYDKSL